MYRFFCLENIGFKCKTLKRLVEEKKLVEVIVEVYLKYEEKSETYLVLQQLLLPLFEQFYAEFLCRMYALSIPERRIVCCDLEGFHFLTQYTLETEPRESVIISNWCTTFFLGNNGLPVLAPYWPNLESKDLLVHLQLMFDLLDQMKEDFPINKDPKDLHWKIYVKKEFMVSYACYLGNNGLPVSISANMHQIPHISKPGVYLEKNEPQSSDSVSFVNKGFLLPKGLLSSDLSSQTLELVFISYAGESCCNCWNSSSWIRCCSLSIVSTSRGTRAGGAVGSAISLFLGRVAKIT
nr:hypothetical protein [Tanacetum cinerariifolium]